MIKQNTVNIFNNGMVMDTNPLVTPNNVLTSCLNGTLITNNGNENVLQNDMGNGRVETAFLPEGYVPLGTAELGGIIYIVSYNPLINKSQIGCFPSPERNITTDELGESTKSLTINEFYSSDDMIKTPMKKLILLDKELHPGDKFLISCPETASVNYLSAKLTNNTNPDFFPRYLKLNVVAILDNGLIYNLNDSLVWNDNYYIYPNEITKDENGKLDLDEYRDLIKSNYSVFSSKVDGKLAILAELECIENFDVSWDAKKNDNDLWDFYFYLNWTYKNNVSKNKINLYSIRVECDKGTKLDFILDNYPKKFKTLDNDISHNTFNTFYTPYYVDNIDKAPDYNLNNGITTPRKNDGTDNLFLLYKKYTLLKDANGIANFTVYPGMPFGYLEYLKCEFQVNLDNLGTGKIDLKEYRYFYENSVTLNWALEAYPERNKNITSVKFKFYKFDDEVYNWVKNNKSYIDNNRYIKSKDKDGWEIDKDNVIAVNGGLTYNEVTDEEYIIPRQSSYSGHFTENIDTLEENQLYLTEIEINYNKEEKIYKYYRFLYTSDIFNDYYFSENDYSKIKLQDALKIQHSISSLKLTNKDQELNLTLNGINEDKIPLSTEEKETKNYIIKGSFNSDVTFNVDSTSNVPLFKISTDISSMETPIIEYSDNSQKLYLDYNQTSGSSEDIKEIKHHSELTGSFNKNSFDGNFKLTLETPFKVDYKKATELAIPYSLEPLDIDCSWVIVDGKERHYYIYTSNSYRDHNEVADIYMESYGDDSQLFGPLSKYPKVYNEIKNKLKSCDVAAFYFRTYHGAEEGKLGTWTNWLLGDYKGGEKATASNMIFFLSGSNDFYGNPKFLIYAILDSNDDVRLFTFAVDSGEVMRSWYNKSTVPPTRDYKWPFSTMPFALSHDIKNDDLEFLKKPFEKYYKLVDSKETHLVLYWSRIYYYNNYTWTNNFSIKCRGTNIITINDVKIEEDGLPNNLNYEKDRDIVVKDIITDKENFNVYLDMLLYATGSSTLIKYPDGRIEELKNANPKSIYDKFGTVISHIKLDYGIANELLTNLTDSKHKIKCIDGRLKVEVTNVPLSNNLMIGGRSEEQGITISDIIKITE